MNGPDSPAPWAVAGRPGPGDRAALVAMLARCTAATRYGRFHAPVRARVLAQQAWILGLLRRYGTCETVLSYGAYDVALH